MTDAMLDGLTDYTSDERGDVGSWARMSCVKGLTAFTKILFPASPTLSSLADYLPPTRYHDAIGGILKQGVERLDNVRQLAGECFNSLLVLPLPAIPGAERWKIYGDELLRSLFLRFAHRSACGDNAAHLYQFQWHRDPQLERGRQTVPQGRSTIGD